MYTKFNRNTEKETMDFKIKYVLYTLHRDRDRDGEPLFSIMPVCEPLEF